MSFRELRNFTETMKSLGYHRLISMDNFRTPNFELVADILFWFASRFDPTNDLSDDISTEIARVDFLKSAARLLFAKANVKLNIRKLYQADGYAVQELLKVSSLLFKATSLPKSDVEGSIPQPQTDLKDARAMAAAIIDSGSKLYTLLGNEPNLKTARDRTMKFIDEMSHNLESDNPQFEIDKTMRMQINALADQAVTLTSNCRTLESDRASIQTKIERKQVELDRAVKRLKSMKKVKPAFMAEYAQLEAELKSVYAVYMDRFVNLNYLESEMQQVQFAEQELKLESDRELRKMRRHLRDEELRILRGEQQVDENHIDDPVESDAGSSEEEEPIAKPGNAFRMARPRAADPRGRNKDLHSGAVVGSMIGGDSSDETEESDFTADEEQELNDEDDESMSQLDQEEDEEEDDDDNNQEDTDF
ncbi:Clusterin-associated protein 1 [Plasmodiophora brassicae]